jgi:ribosomal protein L3 glutamine methyltransferase
MTSELTTIRDLVRYGVTQFTAAQLSYGQGTESALEDAVFIVFEALDLPHDGLELYWDAVVTGAEKKKILKLIEARVKTRTPTAYLLNRAYLQGYRFYVDERVIVPRSFIAEILRKEIAGETDQGLRLYLARAQNMLDLCTGSGCLAILAAHLLPQIVVDAVELSPEAAVVARMNVLAHDMGGRVTIFEGDLFASTAGKYDAIITNPPYVDAEGMRDLPEEYGREPAMALAAGPDGLDIVHRILKEAPAHLTDNGILVCEIGRCRPALTAAYPNIPFHWLESEHSEGEVFWLTKSMIPA